MDEQYPKFAIMGIFGTVTLFLNNQALGNPDSLSARLAIVASLLIFALSAVLIARESVSEISPDGGVPNGDDVGLVIICLCCGILSVVVVSAVSIFSIALQILVELSIVVLAFLGYLRLFPIRPYLRGENIHENADTEAAIAFAVILTVAFLTRVGGYIIQISENIIGVESVIGSPVFIAFIPIQYLLLEGFLGLAQIFHRFEEGVQLSRSELAKSWSIRSSITVSSLAVGLVTLYTLETAEAVVGSNYGFFRVFGMHSSQFVLLHWAGLLIAFAFIVVLRERYEVHDSILRRIGQLVALIAVSALFFDIVFVVPRGTHAIPL